ncbi:MAG: hypothetical protein HC830_06760 [Bacteroidetes bacterium]|nr:hypothetical protein [Bacteroidota bacterium]
MSKKLSLVNGICAGFGIFGIVVVAILVSGSMPTRDQSVKNIQGGKFTSVALPNEFNFAGEDIPLENFDVKEALDKELLVNTYWHSQTFLLIKRANRFFPVIEPILKKEWNTRRF